MHLLLSGEGKGDMGQCANSQSVCITPDYQPGAMAWFVDKLVEQFIGYEYSHLAYNGITFVSEKYLVENKLPAQKKAMILRGKKKPPETQYYYQNARALSEKAKSLSNEINDKVIAVLFHDADGTASAGRGHWQDKVNSMKNGFATEDYADLGVAMIPNPKSEAWLLCALKNNAYQHCAALESESGNDKSLNPLKDQLEEILGADHSVQRHIDLINDGTIDVMRVDMPSFNYFKLQLKSAVIKAQRTDL